MSKRRLPLTDFALPIPGLMPAPSRVRAAKDERIRIENGRRNGSLRLDGESLEKMDTMLDSAAVESKRSKAELAGLEDAALLRRFQDGDETAFYTLFERRHKEIYTHCYRMCGRDAEKANDAFQDTFVKVFSRKELFTDASNGRAWLYRIATNTCLNQLRYDKRHPSEALDANLNSTDPSMQPDFATEQDSLRGALEGAVAKLPIELREPFLLREMEDFSYEDAAAQLGITVAACRQRVYRAKQMLREELEEVVTGEAPKKKKRWGFAA